MFYVHQRLEPEFEELLGRALAGEELSRADGEGLTGARGSELPALMLAASLVRDQGRGRTVTYSRKVFIPLTNLCRQKCGYCTFARGPKDPLAHTMSPDEVLAVAEAGRRQGCKEALFSLGEKPEEIYDFVRDDLRRFGHETTISYLREMCALVLNETDLRPPPSLTPDAYGLYLLAGINDWGGVSPLTIDYISPEAPWPKVQELREVTEAAGFDLRERLPTSTQIRT